MGQLARQEAAFADKLTASLGRAGRYTSPRNSAADYLANIKSTRPPLTPPASWAQTRQGLTSISQQLAKMPNLVQLAFEAKALYA